MKALTLFVFLFVAAPVEAAWHLYLVPVIGDGSQANPRRPKYAAALGVPWAAIDFGAQPVMLVAADVSNAQDTAAAANGDVTKIPDNLDATVTAGTLAAVQNALESRHIPGSWVGVGTTYRSILRTFISVSLLMQRYSARRGDYVTQVFSGSVNLNTAFSSLPLAARQAVSGAAQDLKLDSSGFTGASTLREILKAVADQLANVPRQLGGVTI